jgi:hypothetical protein
MAITSRQQLQFYTTQNLFDNIHSDPRWLLFLRKLGRAPNQLAKIEFKMPPLPLLMLGLRRHDRTQQVRRICKSHQVRIPQPAVIIDPNGPNQVGCFHDEFHRL